MLLVASLGALTWLCHEEIEAHLAADAFMDGLAGDGVAAARGPVPCPGSGVVPEAFRQRGISEIDWDFGFRVIRTRDGRERLSRQGFMRDAASSEERWFKLTLQREDDDDWCVLALTVDAVSRKLPPS